jgi:hypothetical protein
MTRRAPTCAAAVFAQQGFDGVMTKPLNMGTLVPTLAAIVREPMRRGSCEVVQMFDAAERTAQGAAAAADTTRE